jgi:hypothetical protein
MKKILCLIVICGLAFRVNAQGFFNQNGTMIKNTIRQIALLAMYGSYLKKGYKIMEDGWNTVHDWKNGELMLHTSYINSLGKVNPKIKGEQIDATEDLADKLLSGCTLLQQDAIQSEVLNDEEISDLKSMLKGYLEETTEDIDELNLVITDGKLSMTDDERMKQVDRLYGRTVKVFQQFKSLDRNTRSVIAGRKESELHNQELRQWTGINHQP